MCYFPIEISNGKFPEPLRIGKTAFVPCGRCLECRRKALSMWKYRVMKENEAFENRSLFATLTYDDEHLWYTENGNMSLNYSDVQKFIKRIRKNFPEQKFKYIVAGEYGEKTHRPHYHAIFLGINNPTIIENTWKEGSTDISNDVNEKTIAYTLKYILKSSYKQMKGNKKPKLGDLDDRNIEKALFSQGIGKSVLTPSFKRFYLQNLTAPVETGNGKIAMPRYLTDKIFDDEQKIQRSLIQIPNAMAKQLERFKDQDQLHLDVKNEMRSTLKYLKKQKDS